MSNWTLCGLIEQVQLRLILRRGLDEIETLAQRNEALASSRFSADLKIMPSMKNMIIGCVDPVDIFGLAPVRPRQSWISDEYQQIL